MILVEKVEKSFKVAFWLFPNEEENNIKAIYNRIKGSAVGIIPWVGREMVMENLKMSFEKDASLKDMAKKDREFIKFFENSDFLAMF